ncbi:MAG: hypothetical protein L0346_10830 [Chloroflexi bacterium]|nr:hypothetical protein [Chloroflexota bacterium]
MAEAAVYPLADENGSQIIAGAVVAKAGTAVTDMELLKYLAAKLPAYSLPSQIELLPRLPRTSTGKVDRRALQGRRVELIGVGG